MRIDTRALIAVSWSLASAAGAFAAFVSSPAALNSNELVSWSQLGSAGSSLLPTFLAMSKTGITVAGVLSSPTGGTLAEVCPATNCNFSSAPGFHAGDFLVWTEDATGNGTGPIGLAFNTPVRGAGLYLELTAPGTFSVIFTALVKGNLVGETVTSDSAGDPLFLGVLDPAADVTGIAASISSCTPGSPGGCNAADFAIDSLNLTTAVPEPAALFPVLLVLGWMCWRSRSSGRFIVFAPAAMILGAALVHAQDPIPFVPGDALIVDGTSAMRDLPKINFGASVAASPLATPALPIWRYQTVSPVNGITYSGYMVGLNPFSRGARTTTIPVVLVPVVVTFQNTTSGFTATFDPSSAPDAGCTAGETVMKLVEESPIFQASDWTLNGIYAGHTQYVDAFQRANFWQYVQNTGDAYHTILSYTEGPPLTMTVSYSAPTPAAEVRVGLTGPCTNPAGSGSINAGSYEGIVDFVTMHTALNDYITAHAITPDQFVIFMMYNMTMSQSAQPGQFVGGYHFWNSPYPQSLTSPGQTYTVAHFQTNSFSAGRNLDVATLSHEVAEWMNDPGGFNSAPLWGHIGQETGCSRFLEVGDPLTGTTFAVTGANGFTYHLQEMAFFSWFFRTPSIGASGLFSDAGTLLTDAGSVCQ